MRLTIVLVSLGLLCLPVMAIAELDVDGAELTPGPPPHDNRGYPCGSCPYCYAYKVGTFMVGDFYFNDRNSYCIIQFDNEACVELGRTSVSSIGYAYGLGYDHTRDVWVIDDPAADYMYVVDMNGAVINSWPTTPSGNTGPVGCAYDNNRDVYWSCCWMSNRLYSYDPTTGAPVGVLNCPAGSRVAGLGYDMHNDVLAYNGRDQGYSYWVDAESGALLASAPIPNAGSNNGSGLGVEGGSQNAWVTHYEMPEMYCLEGMGATAVESATWGQIKGVFK
jgi:hypothetical protein